MNLSSSIIAKSDQLNADDLMSGPKTFTVVEVKPGNDDQPVSIVLAEWPKGRPFKPSKTVMRILVFAWGEESDDWPEGARMTLFRDPDVKWAGQAIGGIRVKALSHIKGQMKVALQESKGKKTLHVIDALPETAPTSPPVDEATVARNTILAEIKTAAESAGVDLATVVSDWAESHGGEDIRAASDLGSLELLRDDLRGKASA